MLPTFVQGQLIVLWQLLSRAHADLRLILQPGFNFRLNLLLNGKLWMNRNSHWYALHFQCRYRDSLDQWTWKKTTCSPVNQEVVQTFYFSQQYFKHASFLKTAVITCAMQITIIVCNEDFWWLKVIDLCFILDNSISIVITVCMPV